MCIATLRKKKQNRQLWLYCVKIMIYMPIICIILPFKRALKTLIKISQYLC